MQLPPPGMPGVPRAPFSGGPGGMLGAGPPGSTPGYPGPPAGFQPNGVSGPNSVGGPGIGLAPPGAFGRPPTAQLQRMNLGPQGPMGGMTMPPPGAGMGPPPGGMGPPGMGPPGMGPGIGPPGIGPPGMGPPGMGPPGMGPGMGPPGMGPPGMGPPGMGPPGMGPPGMGPPGMGPPGMGRPGPPSVNGGMGMPPPGRPGMPPPPFANGMPPPGPPGSMPGPPGMSNGFQQGPPRGMPHPPGPPGSMQGMPPPGGPPGMPPMHGGPPGQHMHPSQQRPGSQSQNRIDPTQIPRPPTAPAQEIIFTTREGGSHKAPPAAASRFVVKDYGNAGPRYMRCAINQVPFTSDLLHNSALPFALVVSPMALPGQEDDRLQVVDNGPTGPVRCTRCKAYMNPFMRWTNQGRNFTCNFCGASNPTPDAYFQHLGPDGRRQDANERPELCRGSVEYVATAEYAVRPPMAPAHFFIVDASQQSVATGALATACDAISGALEALPYPDRTLVGIATFDSVLHFYSLRPNATQPQMLVVGDVHEVFAPDSAPLLLPLADNREALQGLLKTLPEMWANNRVTESCGGAAIEAAVALLRENGGKVHAFMATLPSVGIHALKLRDSMNTGGDKEKLVGLLSADNTIKSLGTTAADFQIAIDISLLAQNYMDVATLGDLVSSTGGTLYQYTPFNPVMDQDQVLNDLKWNVERPQAMEAVMRVRCSQGLDVQSYTGHFYRQPNNPTDVYLPAVDSDKSILASIAITEKLAPGSECFLQAALLYTALDGQRRIRVHTLALPVTDSMVSVFKGADLDAYTCHLSRKVASSLPGASLASVRDSVTTGIVATLLAYRKYCASNSSSVQLILPEALKLLPLHALALIKGSALKDGAKLDDRSGWCSSMLSLPAARITPLLYPRLIPFHKLLEAGGLAVVGGLSDGLVASAESMEAGGVYLLENGRDAILYIDKDVAPGLLQDIMGVSSYDELLRAPANLPLLPLDTRASAELSELLMQVRMHRSSYMRLRVARKGDAAEVAFFNGLVEDRSTAGQSYVEYLCTVHRLIQDRMTKVH